MNQSQKGVFKGIRLFSSSAAAIAIVLSLVFSQSLGRDSLNWQILMAAIALAIGIPHGSLDHLVTLPRTNRIRMAIFICLYVCAALIAIWALLQWNVVGFIAVVLMSSLHFGVGDSAFISELDSLENRKGLPITSWAYASASGLLPVVIPLVNERSTAALERINKNLVNWHQGFTVQIQLVVAAISSISIVTLFMKKRFRDALDICLLAALAIFAPPLVAFSVYFGCWHAMRHTARLTTLLPQSLKAYEQGNKFAAFKAAVIPGLPALLGTVIFVALLAGFRNQELSKSFFWFALVTVWALTVPHMIVTAKLDRATFNQYFEVPQQRH